MIFHLKNPRTADTAWLLESLRADDPDAMAIVEAGKGVVHVTSALTLVEIERAFARAGVELASRAERKSHLSGGSVCCGSCA